MFPWPRRWCYLKSCGSGAPSTVRRTRNEVLRNEVRLQEPGCPLCPLCLCGELLFSGPRGLHLHQLRPEGSDRPGTTSARSPRHNHAAERLTNSAEGCRAADLVVARLAIGEGRRQGSTIRHAALRV